MIFQVGCIINTKLASFVDIICRTSLGFHSWCPESTRPTDSCFQGTSCEKLMMYGGLYQHTHVVLYIYYLLLQELYQCQIQTHAARHVSKATFAWVTSSHNGQHNAC